MSIIYTDEAEHCDFNATYPTTRLSVFMSVGDDAASFESLHGSSSSSDSVFELLGAAFSDISSSL